jgi:hypothetical protein
MKPRQPGGKTLAQEVYSHLPRELRNHVYAFCVEGSYDNEVIVRRSTNPADLFSLLIREHSSHQSYRWIEDPIVSTISARRLGLHAAREMIESYYWTRTFKFSDRDLYLLVPFLQNDQFRVGVTPASYARRLKLRIQPFVWAQLRSPEARKSEEERCIRTIEALGNILSTRTEVTIDVDIAEELKDDGRCSVSVDRAQRTLRKIVQVVDRLKDRGLRVDMMYSRTWDE